MSNSFFTGTDAELYIGSTNFLSVVGLIPATYGLTPTQILAYTNANTVWTTAYETANNPQTRTKGTIAAKNAARKVIRDMSSDLAKIIDGNPTVTDQQKIDINLNVRKTPAPIPASTVSPAVDLVSVTNRTVMVHIHDSAASNKRGKPAGVVAAWVYTFIGQNYPADPAAWEFVGSATRAKHEIVFADSVAAGQQAWIRCAWINRKQQAGPFSEPITTNIQGGGSAVTGQDIKIAA